MTVDLLEGWVLGLLEPEEAAEVERALAADPSLAAEAARLEATLAGVLTASPPAPVSPALRGRLFAAVSHGERFAPFAARVAALVDAGAERAASLLRKLDDPDIWDGLGPGIALAHIRPGPALAGADVGFVRLEPGAAFPHHHHLGQEDVLVLQGGLRDSLGTVLVAGDAGRMEAGSAHSFEALPGEPLIYLVTVWGVEIPGVVLEEPARRL